MKATAIIQARVNSMRLPGKVLKEVCGKTIIEICIQRLKKSKIVREIILATTENTEDNELENIAKINNILCVRGSEENVLARYNQAIKESSNEIIVRLTGDCPLIDPLIVDNCISTFEEGRYDYLSNSKTFPDGMDVEVFRREVLIAANKAETTNEEKEHVTMWIRKNEEYRIGRYDWKEDLSDNRWTLDEPEDLEVITNIFEYFNGNHQIGWEEILYLSRKKPELFKANDRFNRNEGVKMNKGQKLWKRAKKIIPGGNMLLSKRAEMFLPEKWPSYFSKAKGCEVWDMENNKYIDMSIMGIGTNILGYGDEEVDKAVLENIKRGNMSTLNCPEEVYLAEKLVAIHPWADQVRFARSGGEANAIAIRIARAATGRDTVAICGYHGWHDWYLASNIQTTSGLKEHLLPGLEPNGVPKTLKDSVQPFSYNRIDQLEDIIQKYDLAAVKMEVVRSNEPKTGFLEAVRSLCDRNNIILIFDECTSGFRETNGGIHIKYGITPDMAMFGKALGNGYAITSVIGKESIMQAAQSTFISSTFWTERIGPTAALKTLEIMEKTKSWEIVTRQGMKIKKGWLDLAKIHGLDITLSGISALSCFTIESEKSLEYKTYITQEMLKMGYLAGTSCYVCTKHTDSVIEQYMEKLDKVFKTITECENGRSIDDMLEGPVCHSGFKRLN